MKYFIVVDMQKSFTSMELGTPEAVKIVDAVAEKIREMKELGYEIITTQDTHGENYLETTEGKYLPVPHCIIFTEGWKIEDAVQEAAEGAINIHKNTFGYMDWKDWIEKEPEEIAICGLCTDICVVTNALILKTLFPDTKVVVFKDLCAGVTPESHQAALMTMGMCQIEVI